MAEFDPAKFQADREKAKIRKILETMPLGMKGLILTILSSEGDRSYYFNTCLTCFHFAEDTEQCNKFKVRPPAKVIANGCPDYDDKDIPF
jgi:hypothetical protein